MSILDALKNLVVKRGGTPKGSNIAEVIDDLAETSSGGGGVITIDYNSLTQTEKIVDLEMYGTVGENISVFLYDIDLNSQYRLLTKELSPPVSMLNPINTISVATVSECPDTESETFELAETISGETTMYMTDFAGTSVNIVPTTTQFKTYKKSPK
jgi:hypothetical protein